MSFFFFLNFSYPLIGMDFLTFSLRELRNALIIGSVSSIGIPNVAKTDSTFVGI